MSARVMPRARARVLSFGSSLSGTGIARGEKNKSVVVAVGCTCTRGAEVRERRAGWVFIIYQVRSS